MIKLFRTFAIALALLALAPTSATNASTYAQFFNGIKQIQRGTCSPASLSSCTGTISSVTTSKSILINLGCASAVTSGAGDIIPLNCVMALTNSTTVTVSFPTSATGGTNGFEVVEYY